MRCNHSSLSYIRTSRQDEWRNYTLSMEANFKRNPMRYLKIVTTITVVVVAAIHVVISIVEMFLWQNPLVYQRLDFPADVANQVAPIVQNAGLYNGFIAAGLIWAAFAKSNTVRLRVFFLVCVIIAGIFGALTLKWTTLALQTLPGFIALASVWLTSSQLKLQD